MKIDFPFEKDLDRIFFLLGYEARLVGGCVRDFLLYGKLVEDIDIATSIEPSEVIRLLSSEFKVIPTGIEHGTVTVIGDKRYEITTLRKDELTDGRFAKVSFNSSYEEDAKRRDFTINALYLDYSGNLYDYFDGLMDLKQKKVRFIGNAYDRIMEDYLRILRFFRFSMRFGSFDFENLNICYLLSENLLNLSKERVTKEWFDIIKGEYFFEYFKYFEPIMKLLRFNIPMDINFEEIKKLSFLGLTAFFYSKDVFLCLSNLQKKYINNLLTFVLDNEVDGIVAFNKYGIEFFQDKLIINHKNFSPIFVKNCPVTGQDLIRLGYSGKEIGTCLRKLEYDWYLLKGECSKEELLSRLEFAKKC